jgi:hypothetical protein
MLEKDIYAYDEIIKIFKQKYFEMPIYQNGNVFLK